MSRAVRARTSAQLLDSFINALPADHAQIIREALERAHVVGVLDAWAERTPGWDYHIRRITDGRWECASHFTLEGEPLNDEHFHRYGPTPDAARAAAAKAIERGEV